MNDWLVKPKNYEECLAEVQELVILMEKAKESIKCSHCGNNDPSMIEKLEAFQGKHYKWDVTHDKFLMFLCLICSKEF